MKKIYVLAMVLLVAAVVALPGAAQSAMWVGGELGGNLVGSADIDASGSIPGHTASATATGVKFDNPQVIGGLTIGYDFVNSGFAGYAWPDWMKYFSFATDFTYNRFSIQSQNTTLTNIRVDGNSFPSVSVPVNVYVPGSRIDGYMAAWTFLFMGHYGFFPDSEVPAGRVHPYIGVGPAILFSGINAGKIGIGSASATDIALVAEGGIRFMALSNVSIDVGFRYRYACPSYDFSGTQNIFGHTPVNVNLNTTVNSYTFLTRVSYHF